MLPIAFPPEKNAVVCVGAALVDVLIHENDAFLETAGVRKGGQGYVAVPHMDTVLAAASGPPSVVPGGSACNTAVGVGRLGGKARFLGKRGEDDMGRLIEAGLKEAGVEPLLVASGSPTGRVVSIITPDAQRTMLTFLGAAAELAAGEVPPGSFDGAAVVHVEGYLVYNEPLIRAVMEGARAAGAMVSLDLAAFTVVEEAKDLFRELADRYVDILIANEDEAAAFTGITDEEKALSELAAACRIAVVKMGSRGSLISAGNTVTKVASIPCPEVRDTTGAGDLWASGFLYGLVSNMPAEKCGEIASACGCEVCGVVGADIPAEGWSRIRAHL